MELKMKIGPLIGLVVCLLASACSEGARSGGTFSCSSMPKYGTIEQSEVSVYRLINTFLSESSPDQISIARQAAGDVERSLSGEFDRDIGLLFYQGQVTRLEKYCRPGEGSPKTVVAMRFIELQSAALSNAGGLREADEVLVDTLLPKTSINLDSRTNTLILAAACSKSKNPLLAEALHQLSLPCAGD